VHTFHHGKYAEAPHPGRGFNGTEDAEASRATLAKGITTPSWFFTSIGAAIAVQIASTAVGLGATSAATLSALVAGIVASAAVAGVQLARFRRLNGVWVGGLLSRVVLGTGALASASYAVAIGAATWAAFDAQWWLVVIWSAIGGAAYALSGRRWLRVYPLRPRATPRRNRRCGLER